MSDRFNLGRLSMPAKLGSYDAVPSSIHDYEKQQPGLGCSVSYIGDQGGLTAYTYTYGIEGLANSIDSADFQHQISEAVQAIANSEAWVDLRVFDDDVFALPGRDQRVRYVVLAGTTQDSPRPLHNIVWLTVVNGTFVKVRCTTRASEATKNLAERVARGLLFHFGPPPARGGTRFDDSPLSASVLKELSGISGVGLEHLAPGTKLRGDLGLSDLDLIGLFMALEMEHGFELSDDLLASVETAGDLVTAIQRIAGVAAPPTFASEPAAKPAQKSGLLGRLFGGK